MNNSAMNIQVSIERLVLDGFDLSPAERPLLQTALERELSRLLAGGKVPALLRSGGAIPAIRAAAIRPATAVQPDALGRQIARAVYRGMLK